MQTTNNVPVVIQQKTSKALFAIFCVWTFFLLGRPQDYLPLIGKLRPGIILVILAMVFYGINFKQHRLALMENRQCRLFFLLVSVMMISIPFAVYRGGAFRFFFETYMNGIFFFFLAYKIVADEERLRTTIWLVCLGCGGYTINALLSGTLVGVNRLSFGTLFDPNDLAFFIISILPFNFLFISRDNPLWKRFVSSINIVIGFFCILLTGSRGGFLAACIVFGLLIFMRTLTIKRRLKIIMMIIAFTGMLFGAGAIDFSRFETMRHLAADYNIWDETGRIVVWKRGLELMLTHPLTGVGVSCFSEAIGRNRSRAGLLETWQAPHNSLVQIGAETGLVGFMLFAVISYKAIRIFAKTKNIHYHEHIEKISEMARIGFVGHFVTSMFLSQAYSIYWIFFVVLSAIINNLLAAASAQSKSSEACVRCRSDPVNCRGS